MCELVAAILVEIVGWLVCGGTGHFLLWALSCGRRPMFDANDDYALVVGLVFWVSAIGGVVWLLSR
jgi:hypothetical protein